MEIVKVGLDDDDNSDKLQRVEIFESHSSRIILVEPDPANPLNLFVIDDE